MNRAFSWRNRVQAADIFLGTCPPMVRSLSIATAYRSLLMPISLLQGNCLPTVGVQMFLKTWCPRMQLSTASSCCSYSLYHVELQHVCNTKHGMGACLARAWSSARLKSTNIFVCTGFGQSAKFSGYTVCHTVKAISKLKLRMYLEFQWSVYICIHHCKSNCITARKVVFGCFNHRVVTLVADSWIDSRFALVGSLIA